LATLFVDACCRREPLAAQRTKSADNITNKSEQFAYIDETEISFSLCHQQRYHEFGGDLVQIA